MKKSIIIATIFVAGVAKSQVGINTANPQGTFHVDGGKDNATTGAPTAAQQANDFIVTSTGAVGVGTTSPSVPLHINSSTSPALRLVDGTQGVGKVLSSDANGNASWVTNVSVTPLVYGTISGTNYSGPVSNQANQATGTSITLPKGKWVVISYVLLTTTSNLGSGQGIWTRLTWSDTNTGNQSSDVVQGGLISGSYVYPSLYGIATGCTVINNTSSGSKTYYLVPSGVNISGGYSGNWDKLGGAGWGENSFVAIPSN